MSATAFQRLRREQAAKKQPVAVIQPDIDKKPAEPTNKELMVMLDKLGVEYDKRATKAVLVDLLEKAQNQTNGSDENQEQNTGVNLGDVNDQGNDTDNKNDMGAE